MSHKFLTGDRHRFAGFATTHDPTQPDPVSVTLSNSRRPIVRRMAGSGDLGYTAPVMGPTLDPDDRTFAVPRGHRDHERDAGGARAAMSSSDSPHDGKADRGRTPGARIRRARKAQRWSLQQLAVQMRLFAGKRGYPTASVSSLKSMISGWEHDRAEPDENNRRLLAAVLKVTVQDLGLTEDPDVIW